jgi:hypothetical protein
VYGQVEALAQVVGEGLHLLGLGAFGSAHAEWQANYDFADGVLADYLFEGCEVLALVAAL